MSGLIQNPDLTTYPIPESGGSGSSCKNKSGCHCQSELETSSLDEGLLHIVTCIEAHGQWCHSTTVDMAQH